MELSVHSHHAVTPWLGGVLPSLCVNMPLAGTYGSMHAWQSEGILIAEDCLVYVFFGVQAADLIFGANAQPHDFLHEPLLRLVATGALGSAAVALALNVSDRCQLYFFSKAG